MDFLRKFIETVFCFYRCDLLEQIHLYTREIIDKRHFVISLREKHPQLSDDSINLIYKEYTDAWMQPPDDAIRDNNMFYVLIHFCKDALILGRDDNPEVKFEDLFKWREVTELTGETLLVCAYLAYCDVIEGNPHRIKFLWANLLPTDNKMLSHVFENMRLIDLHQHLKASTSIFGISWVCLMNHINHRNDQFRQLFIDQDKAQQFYAAIILAAKIRLYLYRKVIEHLSVDTELIFETSKLDLHFEIEQERYRIHSAQDCFIYDYAAIENYHPYAVYVGERRFLYSVLKHIYSGDSLHISCWFYRYLIIKAKLRSEMVQFNANVGFANFSDFERKKEIFIEGKVPYENLLLTLPLYEAHQYYHQDYIETRVAPKNSYKDLRKKFNQIIGLNERREYSGLDYRIIYHFIKLPEPEIEGLCRNFKVRRLVRKQANALNKLLHRHLDNKVIAIDAANSEMYCRPEVFSDAFRLLSSCRHVCRTYHVGEDFYDIADGLRAIDEAINFLNLKRGDRLGHCLALGIQPEDYYKEHDNHLIIPIQILLDDAVWLKMKAAQFNIYIPPIVDRQLEHIFYSNTDYYENRISMIDYFESMKLRSKLPEESFVDGRLNSSLWQLYRDYHYDFEARQRKEKVWDFIIYPEYVSFIKELQDKMIADIERKQLVIECCPTSNYKIERLFRYENHPIFRFCNVKQDGHHLPVTVNTDDLGIFYTSLPREFELLALALLKKKDKVGQSIYTTQEVYEWIERIIRNAHVYRFG